jgi:hypothetical protein
MNRIFTFLLLPVILFAQSSNWNSVVDLNLSVNDYDRLDLYIDTDGIHVLVENGSTLKYYLYSLSGSQIRTSTIDGSISSTFSKLVGWDGTIYVSYKEGSTIYTKKSSNAGQSWSNLDNINLSSSSSDGLEICTDGNGLHIVYNVVSESYYRLSEHGYSTWGSYKTVTDEEDIDGGRPTVTTSSGRAHVGFTLTGYNGAMTRDKDNSTWQSSQTVQNNNIERNSTIATSAKLHALYQVIDIPYLRIYYKNRDISGSTWSSSTLIANNSFQSEQGRLDLAVTEDDRMHMVYGYLDLYYREWDDGTLSSQYKIMDFESGPRISANGNDVYVIGITDDGSSGYELKMRQRNFAPLPPVIEKHYENDHPEITWDKPCLDAEEYRVYRKVNSGSYVWLATTSNLYYIDEDFEYDPRGDEENVWYYVVTEDYNNNLSDASNILYYYNMNDLRKLPGKLPGEIQPTEFTLHTAYPNPFNPTTTVAFDIPMESKITIKIFNILGITVKDYVINSQAPGRYKLTWDGTNKAGVQVPSGVYIVHFNAESLGGKKEVFQQSMKITLLR